MHIHTVYINSMNLAASCRDLPSQHISPFSYYSWQLTLCLNPALLPCCFTQSLPSSLIPRPLPCHVLYCAHKDVPSQSLTPNTILVVWSNFPWVLCIAETWILLLVKHKALQSNKAMTVLLTSVLLNSQNSSSQLAFLKDITIKSFHSNIKLVCLEQAQFQVFCCKR